MLTVSNLGRSFRLDPEGACNYYNERITLSREPVKVHNLESATHTFLLGKVS